jgi:hypothetical protein
MVAYQFFGSSEKIDNKEEKKPENHSTILKKTEKKSFQKTSNSIFSRKNIKNIKNSYIFTHVPSSSTERKKLQQEKVIFHQKRQQMAKALYQRQQQYMSQQARAYKNRDNYNRMQRVMRQKGKGFNYQNQKMMKDKYVRSQMARQQWQLKQQRVAQMMKNRSKIKQGVRNGN